MKNILLDSNKIIKHIYVILGAIISVFLILYVIQQYQSVTIQNKENVIMFQFEKTKQSAKEMINTISSVQLKFLEIKNNNDSPISINLTNFELVERVKNSLQYNIDIIKNIEKNKFKYHEHNLFKKLEGEVEQTILDLNRFQKINYYKPDEYQRIVKPILSVIDQYYTAYYVTEKLYITEIEGLKKNQKIVSLILISVAVFLAVYVIVKAVKNLNSLLIEKYEAEKKLIFSETNFREITENANEGILVALDGKHVFANNAINELLGYDNEELIGTKIEDLVHPDDIDLVMKNFRDRMAGKTAQREYEIKLLSKHGESIIVELHPTITQWLGRQAGQVFVHDIRARKKEHQLLEKQSVIINQIHDSVVSTDLDGIITSWNNGAKYLFGYNPVEIVGKHFSMLYPKSELNYLNEVNAILFNNGEHETEVKLIRKNRTVFYGHLSLSLIYDENKNPVGMIGYTIDITGRKQAEEELALYREELEALVEERTLELNEAFDKLQKENQERIKLESHLIEAKHEADFANMQKSEFINRMSHELRTPMNAILGFSQLLEMDLLDDEHKNYIEEILSAGNHLQEMIDEILDLSKIESGNIRVKITAVSVYEIVLECISLIQPMANEKNIGIINTITDEDEVVVSADYMRLKEVIVNLLTNAVKYNCVSGIITINQVVKNNNIRLTVSDTGVGIDSKNPDDIFEAFNRNGAEFTDIQGTGIGLSISKQLIELMDGSIGYESIAGKGSTFWVELVECQSNTATVRTKNKSSMINTDIKQTNIVYIEDNSANLKLIEHVIRRHKNMNLLSRENAEEGLALIRNEKPDLIILDINLPGMNGFQALELLQEDVELKEIPVFALSAAATSTEIERGLLAGFNRYLTKPIQVNEFIDAIEQVFKVN
ncbi:MAG: PAS domain S-box protein [Gammaproteobacteria bacterium]